MRQGNFLNVCLAVGVLTCLGPTIPASATPSLATLYSFQGGMDGAGPIAGLVADAGKTALYGTTPYGGGYGCDSGCGTVFKLTPPGAGQTQWTETILYRFTPGQPDGRTPMAGVIFGPDGILYGTTSGGGQHGLGTVFSLTPPAPGLTAWREKILYSFKKNRNAGPKNLHRDGAQPLAPLLIDKSGNLYGTTSLGGAGFGTAFRLSPPAFGQQDWTETQLQAFLETQGRVAGGQPAAGLIMDAKGALYGTTVLGAGGSICGSVFKLTPADAGAGPWSLTTLAVFGGTTNVCRPTGTLFMDSAGNIFGTSLANEFFQPGGVFGLAPTSAGGAAWTSSVIYNLPGVPGQARYPYSGLIKDNVGNLYGTTAGYSAEDKSVVGATIFELSPPALGQIMWTGKTIAVFDGAGGALPKSGLLRGRDGTLYGTTQAGGDYNFGTVFAFVRPGP